MVAWQVEVRIKCLAYGVRSLTQSDSEGDDGVKIWNLKDETQFRVPGGPGQRGATTALIWVQRDDEVEDGVVYGTEGGYLISWKEMSYKDVKVCGCIA